jgi:DNA adenine methylase
VQRRRTANKLVGPFVKWVGGKRQLLLEIEKFVPKSYRNYFEPFVGGGAVLFYLQPKHAVINDNNEELINVYKVIKNNPEELIEDLEKHENSKEYFYRIREYDRDKKYYNNLTGIEKASRILYLNKTCYNGLFRVNSSGEFNAPYGSYKKPRIVNDVVIRAVSVYLNGSGVTILNQDYEKSLTKADASSFVYFDPPYDPVSNSANFTGYTKSGFTRDEQKRLKSVCDWLNKKGVRFLLSNSSTDFIRDLYSEYEIHEVLARRAVNSNARGRGEIKEILVRNFEQGSQNQK